MHSVQCLKYRYFLQFLHYSTQGIPIHTVPEHTILTVPVEAAVKAGNKYKYYVITCNVTVI